MIFALLFSLFSLNIPQAEAAPSWGLNDVSYLLPIHERDSANELIHADETSARGTYLPKRFFDRVGKLLHGEDPAITYGNLRVVAVRIDPCFRGEGEFQGCRPMVRFVWQPIFSDSGSVTTADGALHTFYDLTREEFESFANELAGLRAKSRARLSNAALRIHPVIAAEGLKGPFFRGFKALLARFAGEKNFTRMTFMKLNRGGTVWDFGGFNIEAGLPLRISIPRVGKPHQVFMNEAGTTGRDFVSSQIFPEPQDHRNINLLVRDSTLVRGQRDINRIIDNVISARELENPRISPTDGTDCLSCHLAQSTRIWAIRSFPELDLENRHRDQVYASKTHSLENTSPIPDVTTNLRGFGYFGAEPAISRRVIHESAEVADTMNRVFR